MVTTVLYLTAIQEVALIFFCIALYLISAGVKATYLLAVAFLEIIRFSSNGGILNGGQNSTASRSAFSCAFEYLRSPNLMPAVSQCLTAIVHRAFETAISWLVSCSSAHLSFSSLQICSCFNIQIPPHPNPTHLQKRVYLFSVVHFTI